ncbi:dipeptidase [candidate division KSB1 bacterium]|nr:dipeptidase [candidate division KSB1 bacterium]
MVHKVIVILSMLIVSSLFLSCEVTMSEEELTAKARGIHENLLTIDTHDDIPLTFASEEVDPGVRGDRQMDLPKMIEGGLDAGFFIVFVGQTERTPENYAKAKEDAMTKFNAIHRMTEEMYPDKIELAYTADDVVRINNSGKLVACIGIENGYVVGKDLSLLKKYHDLGARYITLAHNGHNDICDSANPREQLGDSESEHNGVSEFGKKVIAEMNRLGIMVDVSHISKKSMLDAVSLSKAPVIASHSSTRALCDVSRNMDDEQLQALKTNGGVIQTVALGNFVKNPPEKQTAMETLFEELGVRGRRAIRQLSDEKQAVYRKRRDEINEKWPPATVQDFVDHIDHAVKLIGIDHVGISSDFDGGGGIEGWKDASETFNVTLELVRRGYSEEEITKIWGGNLLRVWREVERVASEMQATASNN